ncbi:TPA: alkaline phosphatase family protein [Candidatus Micrarchaeota archaeon]|nr:alkaline phosphatase family protein [Candidatus Micrarchaeota archaeon]
MIVIGFDGATWSFITPNLKQLPAFKALLSEYPSSTLECDVRPVHSAPSWTTIFTGLKPEQHGVKDFVMDENERKRLASNPAWLWNEFPGSVAMCIPVAIPPLNSNYDLAKWQETMLSVTEEEMFASTEKLAADAVAAIKYSDAPLIATVFCETDRAQHFFWREPAKLLEHYKSVDRALARLLPFFKDSDFLVLSDHGFTDAEETRRNNWDTVRENQTGGHHPLGIAVSNRAPPTKTSEIHGFIRQALTK